MNRRDRNPVYKFERSKGMLMMTSRDNSFPIVIPRERSSAGLLPDSTRSATISHWKALQWLCYRYRGETVFRL